MIALALALAAACAAEPVSVEEIMARVAANQERAQELRTAFVYRQNLLLRFQRGDGRLAREEQREYTVTPTPGRSEKALVGFAGKYERDGNLVEYAEPGFKYKDLDLDGELMHEFAREFANDHRSRDGIGHDLFPLTGREQEKYSFHLKGRERYRGRDVYLVVFEPNKKRFGGDEGTPWAGEILVDAEELQPVRVTTRLARGIPFLVQSLLGTNLRGVGFDLAYEKFDHGLWFPVRYGGEFELRAVFLYKRKVAVTLRNSDFRRSEVNTRISFER